MFVSLKYLLHKIVVNVFYLEYLWSIEFPLRTLGLDPVDGTTNFVCGFPYTAVCIGVMINKMPVIGVVYNPIMDQMFSAKKDGGATMNGKTLKVSDTKGRLNFNKLF
jgi:fructose-1,6-bisphosphatase/inositol monophosphatase family enzyme